MSGMIGSRQGWKEAPYAQCPAGANEIAARMVEVRWGVSRNAWIVPGLSCRDAQGVPDVMRGEETQILGALNDVVERSAWVCLPGTHSKWVHLEGDRITHFATYMTGEVFAVMKAHSILGRMMADADLDPVAFGSGVLRAREAGGLLHHLFGVRTRGLTGDLSDDDSAAYLSGLLIGHELAALPRQRGTVYLLGAPRLMRLYTEALKCYGVDTSILDADAAVRGLFNLAQMLPRS
jgi:2-dehydro-3-deoxygalactonokinase